MRVKKNKVIEKQIKRLYHLTHLDKAIHYFRSKNRPKAVFIWIPKNAGTSLYNMLKTYGCTKVKVLSQISQRFSQRGLVTFDHMDYAQLVEKNHVSKEYDEKSFKFCFCRNPYDRAVSLYVYLTKKMSDKPSFLAFWQSIEGNIDDIGLYNSKGMSLCNPQYRWIEHVKVDFIGRYENYDEELIRLMKEVGLPPLKVEHRNKSKRKSWKDYYCDESKIIIERLYAKDFEYFDYEIESF